MLQQSMRRSKLGMGLAAVALAATLGSAVVLPALAQQGGGQAGQRERGDRRAQAEQQLKTDLAVSDEEFEALKPMVASVMELRRESQMVSGDRGGRGGRGGPDGGGDNADRGDRGDRQPPELSAEGTAIREALATLKTATENEATAPEVLTQHIASLRAAKAAHAAKLAAAQDELRSVVLARQEAVLIVRGLLD